VNIWDIHDFLKSEEQRISGKVIEIPVDQDLWKKKLDLVAAAGNEFMDYNVAFLNLLQNRNVKFSEHITQQKSEYRDMNLIDMMQSDEFLRGFTYAVNSHIEILKLMQDVGYSPPYRNPAGIRDHLLAFLLYLFYTRDIFKFYFPGINGRVTYAGMVLIQTSSKTMADISGKARGWDQVQNAMGKKMFKVDERTETIKELLDTYPDRKSNKDQRNAFYAEARKITGLTTDRGVDNHVKKILEEMKK